jgi:peroxiredoxin
MGFQILQEKMLFMKILCSLLAVVFFASSSMAQLKPGTMAPEINLPNVQDSLVSLSSFQGKVVLVDFWASWCGPCRASNPEVVKLYKKFRDQGFEVYAVSIDTKKAAWEKAIRKDKLLYTQVNDNGGWAAKAAEKYFVDEIPTTFLLDKTGMIVAIDASGHELEKLVRSLLR